MPLIKKNCRPYDIARKIKRDKDNIFKLLIFPLDYCTFQGGIVASALACKVSGPSLAPAEAGLFLLTSTVLRSIQPYSYR